MMTLASLYCAFRFSPALKQKQVLSELRFAGAPIYYDHSTASWLEGLLGPEMFGTVKSATLRSDDEVAKIASISSIRKVLLIGPAITDASVGTLTLLPQLIELELRGTHIGSEAINRFKEAQPTCNVTGYP
jgi:hypothetical protein